MLRVHDLRSVGAGPFRPRAGDCLEWSAWEVMDGHIERHVEVEMCFVEREVQLHHATCRHATT